MSIAVIDYGSGNLRSVAKALEHVAEGARSIQVTSSASGLAKASHIVLPGVGAFGDCMRGLSALPGMLDALGEQVIGRKKWFLGICVGMQMLFERGHEHGVHKGLGWLEGEVVRLRASGFRLREEGAQTCFPETQSPALEVLKIPHMGWNELAIERQHPLLEGIRHGDHAYFVHSYHAKALPDDIWAAVEYGQTIAAVVGRGHIMGTQFHPEKSQQVGLRMLKNFLMM